MSMNMIILLPILSGFGFLYWATQLDEDYSFLSLVFQLLFIPLVWLSIHFAVIDASITYGSNAELVTLLADTAYYLGWVAFIVGVVIVFVLFGRVKDLILRRKQQKEAELYD